MPDHKTQLAIALTEPVVLLRTSDPSGRLTTCDANDSPTLVRGILTLNVAKPIAISTIQVELSGTLSINYPEAIGSRRVDIPENQKIFSSTVTVFRADRARHTVSVGPRLSTTNADDDERRSRAPSLPRGRSERRNVAIAPLDLDPTPPYTEVDAPGEHPTQALQPLTTDGATEGHELGDISMPPPSSHSHISFSLPNMQSESSITPDLSDDLAHTGPPLEGDGTTLHLSPTEGAPRRAHSSESTRLQPHGNDDDPAVASNSRLRLSLSYVFDAVKEITSGTQPKSRSTVRSERGRSMVRNTHGEQGGTDVVEVGQPDQMGQHVSPGLSEHLEHHLLGLGRFLGLGRDSEKDKDGEHRSKEGENWREFKPGVYSFPISFLLPPHLPPTFAVPNGSLGYTIKAVAHRPGTFTSKFSCRVPLLIVAAPAGDGAGDAGPLSFEQQWQGQLGYSLALSSRLFLLGSRRRLEAAAADHTIRTNTELPVPGVRIEAVHGAATLDLTLVPFEKVKIWRLDIFMDQRVKYFGERGQPFREEDRKQVSLIELQDMCTVEEMSPIDEEQAHKHKHKSEHVRIPLLPTPISPHRSPLLRYILPSADASMLSGPGPYSLSINFGLPDCNDPSGGDNGGLHFTVKHKGSRVKVEHSLRLNMRVERIGNNGGSHDHEEGQKKKVFDIALQTPVTILSCRCVPEYLPTYSQSTEGDLQDIALCACPGAAPAVGPARSSDAPGYGHNRLLSEHGVPQTPSSASASFDGDHGALDERSRSPLHIMPARNPNPPGTPAPSRHSHPPSPGARSPSSSHEQGHHRHSTTHNGHSHSLSSLSVSHHGGMDSQSSPLGSPHHSRPPSPWTRYERLVSGFESEAGEAPPSYESVASGP